MPNIDSAKKRVKVIEKKTLINKRIRSELKTVIKSFRAALNNKDNINQAYTYAIKKIDKAAAKGILHKNTAARKKSALTRQYNAAISVA